VVGGDYAEIGVKKSLIIKLKAQQKLSGGKRSPVHELSQGQQYASSLPGQFYFYQGTDQTSCFIGFIILCSSVAD
jgi:hypothetical protein